MYSVKLSKKILQNHFHYDIWYYLAAWVLITLIWVGIYIFFIPNDQKIDIYISTGRITNNGDELKAAMLMDYPELRAINIKDISSYKTDIWSSTINNMELQKIMDKGSGDIFIIKEYEFMNYSGMGKLMPLDHQLDGLEEGIGPIKVSDIKISSSYKGENHIYGLKIIFIRKNEIQEQVYYLSPFIVCISDNCKNKDKAVEIIKWLVKSGGYYILD